MTIKYSMKDGGTIHVIHRLFFINILPFFLFRIYNKLRLKKGCLNEK